MSKGSVAVNEVDALALHQVLMQVCLAKTTAYSSTGPITCFIVSFQTATNRFGTCAEKYLHWVTCGATRIPPTVCRSCLLAPSVYTSKGGQGSPQGMDLGNPPVILATKFLNDSTAALLSMTDLQGARTASRNSAKARRPVRPMTWLSAYCNLPMILLHSLAVAVPFSKSD